MIAAVLTLANAAAHGSRDARRLTCPNPCICFLRVADNPPGAVALFADRGAFMTVDSNEELLFRIAALLDALGPKQTPAQP